MSPTYQANAYARWYSETLSMTQAPPTPEATQATSNELDVCFNCGGEVRRIARAGRVHKQGGQSYKIPADLALLTCTECGARWINRAEAKAIARAIEAQQKEAAEATEAKRRKPALRLITTKAKKSAPSKPAKTPAKAAQTTRGTKVAKSTRPAKVAKARGAKVAMARSRRGLVKSPG